MRILFYADGRSAISLNWLKYWIQRGDQVHLVSSYPCAKPDGLASFQVLPVAFGSFKKQNKPKEQNPLVWGAGSMSLRLTLRQWLAPLTLPAGGQALSQVVQHIQPDIVHALRIPYEGMTAAAARLHVPLIISVWGNDFTLHARSSPWLAAWTRRVLQATVGLHTDCHRDQRLAADWGFRKGLSTLVIPGNGGIDPHIFHPPAAPVPDPVIINPRGFRNYVRNDTFFKSIPLVLERMPQARFKAVAMQGEKVARQWVERLGIQHAVELLPHLAHPDMADLFRSAALLVSPSTHDGSPNSVLEGMASGCLPIVGDIESLREWISTGDNGLLVNPGDPADLADSILTGLGDQDLRLKAARVNASIISQRADYKTCMEQAAAFYEVVIDHGI